MTVEEGEEPAVDGGSDGFHDVEREGVPGRLIGMKESDTWVESDRETGDAGFGFDQGIQVVQECVGRVGSEAWRSADG